MALNVPEPFVSAELAGSNACASVLLNFTAPAYPVVTLPKLSFAVTVKLNAVPAETDAGAVTTSAVADPADTVIFPEEPVIELVTVSIAAIICVPAVFTVALNVPVPFVSAELGGSTACASVLLNFTVPAYPVATLPKLSFAVTVKLNAVPAVADAGALVVRLAAGPAFTVNKLLGTPPMPLPCPVPVAVIVKLPVFVIVTLWTATPFVNEAVVMGLPTSAPVDVRFALFPSLL